MLYQHEVEGTVKEGNASMNERPDIAAEAWKDELRARASAFPFVFLYGAAIAFSGLVAVLLSEVFFPNNIPAKAILVFVTMFAGSASLFFWKFKRAASK